MFLVFAFLDVAVGEVWGAKTSLESPPCSPLQLLLLEVEEGIFGEDDIVF